MPDPLSTTFAALSDPTRRAILARLALGETSVKELAEPFPISAPSITKHLKVLERAGLGVHIERSAVDDPGIHSIGSRGARLNSNNIWIG